MTKLLMHMPCFVNPPDQLVKAVRERASFEKIPALKINQRACTCCSPVTTNYAIGLLRRCGL